MIVCIAEKPSVARDIAHVLGANESHDGYMEGNGYQVTWTFGHLCTLKEPHDYSDSWKIWALGRLPMIPDKFGIKLIDDGGVKKQFHIIETLMQKADSIINCERRDVKGLYQRARRGEVKNFTGISAPFEAPEHPDLSIDTSVLTLQECVQSVVDLINNSQK